MRATTRHLSGDLNMNAVRSDALFVSTLQPSDEPVPAQVREVIARVVREVGARGTAERVAQEFGDHPELAVARMRWARGLVETVFGPTRLSPRRTVTLPVAASVAHAA